MGNHFIIPLAYGLIKRLYWWLVILIVGVLWSAGYLLGKFYDKPGAPTETPSVTVKDYVPPPAGPIYVPLPEEPKVESNLQPLPKEEPAKPESNYQPLEGKR